ncbi:MAG: hypothetical protein K8L99_15130 [Anaerolineae bacterium]|nr:hypothetical protein [Anaerolineae bacterium]
MKRIYLILTFDDGEVAVATANQPGGVAALKFVGYRECSAELYHQALTFLKKYEGDNSRPRFQDWVGE